MSQQKPPFYILFLLVSFASVGAVLFTPALPAITSFFNVSTGLAQLTITSYLLGYALGQLPYGALANRFGRKPTLYLGISISIIASFLCAFSSYIKSFELLIFARFLQALGACVGLKITFTMIADSFSQTEATKMISRTIIAFAVMPGLAVALGGVLTQLFGWESCFYFLALFGLVILLLSTKLPETARELDKEALNLSSIAHHYGTQFKNKQLMISGLMMGAGSAVIYAFAAKAPFIGIDLLQLKPSVFGLYNLIPLLGMLAGSFLAANIAGRFKVLNILLTGTLSSLVVAILMLLFFIFGALNPFTLFLPVCLIYLCESLVFANISSYGLTHAHNKSIGSAILNFTNLGATVIAVLLVEFIYPEMALLLPISFVFFFLIMLWLWSRLKQQSVTNPH